MIETLHAIVIKSENLGESDKRLTLYSKELGKLRAKIVGVKKTTSKLRSLSLPFTESRLNVYLHGSFRNGFRDPGKIIGGETLNFHLSLRENWDRMIQTATFCETFDHLTRSLDPNLNEYQLVASTLCQMDRTDSPLLVRLRSSLILLKVLGYSLSSHPTWKSYTPEERMLFLQLGRWQETEKIFSDAAVLKIQKLVDSYLEQYLSRPLKTALFQQKVKAAELVKGKSG